MRARKILFLVPYKARDLEGHALVGFHLKRKYGHEVIYTNGYGFELKILKYSPDAVVFDHLAWNFKIEQARLAKYLGMKVVILPTEGLFQDEEGAVRRAGKLHNASHLPDKYLPWGEFPRRALLKAKLMTEEQVESVGCARFDFYRPPYLSMISSRPDFLKKLGFQDTEAPVILWATNTAYASRNAKLMLERQTKKAKKPLSEVQDHILDHKIQFREHSSLVEKLAQRNPQWNFIIKVHPAEWINPYLQISERNPNVRVAFDAPIREFLYHADVLLQRNCTTATEAWMFGKPVLNLELGEYRRPVRPEYARGNHRVFSLEETEEAVRQYLSGKAISPEQEDARKEFIEDFYFRIDGKSAERSAAAINKVLSPPFYTEAKMNKKDELTSQMLDETQKAADAKFANKLKDLLGLDRETSMRFWKKWFRREPADNAGVFIAEPEITPEMSDELYRRFDSLHAVPKGLPKSPSLKNGSPVGDESIAQV